MTFVAPLNPTSDDPLHDLDMASYSLVKSFGGRLGPLGAPTQKRHGTATAPAPPTRTCRGSPRSPFGRSRTSTQPTRQPHNPARSSPLPGLATIQNVQLRCHTRG